MVKIDVDEMDNGKVVGDRLMDGRNGGLPWMVIMDADGKEMVSSNGPDGKNVGCPATLEEVKHFISMIEQTCSDETKAKMGEFTEAINAFGKKLRGD